MMQERTNGMMWMPFVNKVPKQTCTVKPNINKQRTEAIKLINRITNLSTQTTNEAIKID